jgi:hypothetical protein
MMNDISKRSLKSEWTLSFRDTTNVISNFRTSVACICDEVAFNYKAPNIVLDFDTEEERSRNTLLFLTLMNSLAFDYIVRQKFFGANLIKSILMQIAVPDISIIQEHGKFLITRGIELVYTSRILRNFSGLQGYTGPSYVWDEERRLFNKCEIDAKYFHIYGVNRNDLPRIIDSFRILKDKDIEKYGSYRTKELILEIYDKMTEAMAAGTDYQTILDPPPGPPTNADGNFIPMSQWDPNNWPPHIHPARSTTNEL